MNFLKKKQNTTDNFFNNLSPIIIGGCHRSGTSLIRRILDAHSSINCPPEIKFFRDFFGDYNNDELKHLRFFSTARQAGLNANELLNIFGESFVKFHKSAATKNKKKRWADKNPENVLYLNEWTKILNNDLYFVLLIRNPFDVVASILEAGFTKTLPSELNEIVDFYINYSEKGLDFVSKNPEKSIIIKYEALVLEPETTIKDLMNKLNEPFEPEVLKTFNSSKRISGIEDFKVKNTKSIHTNSIGRGKNELKIKDIEFIAGKCKKIIKQFDY